MRLVIAKFNIKCKKYPSISPSPIDVNLSHSIYVALHSPQNEVRGGDKL